MTKDKEKGVPKPKTKKLTKTQKELLLALDKEITNSRNTVMMEFNKVSIPRLEALIERFSDELDLDIENENWEYIPDKFHFLKKD